MHTVYKVMFCIAAVAVIAFTPPTVGAQGQGIGAEQGAVKYLPVISLKDWQNSTVPERRAFLVGFVSMLQMEYAWQGKDALPVNQSTVSTWMRGLTGASVNQMEMALDDYIAKRSGKLDSSVIEALGRIYVKPGLSAEERGAAEKRVAEINVQADK